MLMLMNLSEWTKVKQNTSAELCRAPTALDTEPTQTLSGLLVIHNNRTNRMASAGDESFKFLTYQLPTVGYWPTVALTGNGELGFDSGEGA